MCKILESIIRDHIIKYLTKNDLITPEQHGFVPNKACVTNLLETLDIITEAIDQRFLVDLVLLDFAKAFDKVSHEKLILKLKEYGISNELVRWVREFLSNRKQRVTIGDNFSCWEDVVSGVPQGSVLGPLLFTIFINDLPRNIKNIAKLYADDCKLIGVIKEPNDIINLQNDIIKLQEWANTWQMSFNYDKCKVMHFGKKNLKNIYEMSDKLGSIHKIEKTESERDLGMIITNNLKWSAQVDKAAKTANSVLAQF